LVERLDEPEAPDALAYDKAAASIFRHLHGMLPSRVPNTPIGRLRIVGILEGVSYLALLGVAMPLKYVGGMAIATKIAGWPHGLLFVAYCVTLFTAARKHGWAMDKVVGLFVAALLPFGTFISDRQLKKEAAQGDSSAGGSLAES
jgi:integral membrane protein